MDMYVNSEGPNGRSVLKTGYLMIKLNEEWILIALDILSLKLFMLILF